MREGGREKVGAERASVTLQLTFHAWSIPYGNITTALHVLEYKSPSTESWHTIHHTWQTPHGQPCTVRDDYYNY